MGELILDRFEVVRRLGSGGFGTVYEAWDRRLERPVALKAIDLETPGARRVMREAQAAARLNHAGIVTLYELGADDEFAYLVSELVEGETMARLSRRGLLSDRDVARVGEKVAQALEHAHERGVVHRDVKPQNVIVCGDPRQPKLADFGIARVNDATALTATGTVAGTLAYMAPEQADGADAGPEADCYSLALTLYEAWSGTNPVLRRSPAATARAIGSRLPSLGSSRPDLPPELSEVIDACLEGDPAYRPALAELADVLRRQSRWLSTGRAPHPPAAIGRRLRLGRRWSSSLRRVLAAVPLIALALVLWQLTEGGRGPDAAVVAALVAPMLFILPRSPSLWALPALAPALGAVGLAPAFPALAGLAGGSARRSALLASLGYAWLLVIGGEPAYPEIGLLWVAGAVSIRLLVRGANPVLDSLGATFWVAAYLAAESLVHAGPSELPPDGAIGAAVVVVVGAWSWRRLRTGVHEPSLDIAAAAHLDRV